MATDWGGKGDKSERGSGNDGGGLFGCGKIVLIAVAIVVALVAASSLWWA